MDPRKNVEDTKQTMERLNIIFSECMKYIFGYCIKTSKVIQSELVNLMEPETLVEVVQAQTMEHIMKLHDLNPLKKMLSNNPSDQMLQKIKNHISKPIGKRQTPAMIQAKAKQQQIKRSKLIEYMQPSRKDKKGRDYTLSITNKDDRKLALQVRTGHLYRYNDPLEIKCRVCTAEVRRNHFNQCDALATLLPADVVQRFNNTKLTTFNGSKHKFTIFDQLVNEENVGLLRKIVEWVNSAGSDPI
jgi:hypothetical protein